MASSKIRASLLAMAMLPLLLLALAASDASAKPAYGYGYGVDVSVNDKCLSLPVAIYVWQIAGDFGNRNKK